MAYATADDVQARMTRTMTDSEYTTCGTLLDDVGVYIDSFAPNASDEAKKLVSCSAVIRMIGTGTDSDIPIGATQASMGGLGYSQSWTISSGGSVYTLYFTKNEKLLLGYGNDIICHSPLESMTGGAE